MKTAAQQYFNNFKNHCSTYQLERVANRTQDLERVMNTLSFDNAVAYIEQWRFEDMAAGMKKILIDSAHREALDENERVNYHATLADFTWELQGGDCATLFAVMDEALKINKAMNMKTAAQQYFNNFKNHCSTYQLERVANKPQIFGALAIWAGSEVVDRVIFGESSENLMLTNKGLVERGELPLRAEEIDFLAGTK